MMARGRAKVTTDDVDKWLNEFACFMSDMNLCDKPNLIYNFDESGFGLSGKPPRSSQGCKDTIATNICRRKETDNGWDMCHCKWTTRNLVK